MFILSLLLLTGCSERVDLTPTWEVGTHGTATFRINREARVVPGRDRMRTIRRGTLDLTVTEAGDLNGDPITLSVVHRELHMTREALGEIREVTSSSELEPALVPEFDFEDEVRSFTISPDDTMTSDSERTLDTDPGAFLQHLLAAPDGRVAVGTMWSIPIDPAQDGTDRYRTFKLDSVTGDTARIRMLDVSGHPTRGDIGPPETQSEGVAWIHVPTGLPYYLRIRDKSNRMIGLDTTFAFDWDGVPPSPEVPSE